MANRPPSSPARKRAKAPQEPKGGTMLAPHTSQSPPPRSSGLDVVEDEEVEMNLLEEFNGNARDHIIDEDHDHVLKKVKPPLSKKDKHAMVLLCVLYLIQGVPIGLALGSVPFLLRASLSYSQLGIFALSSMPYSLKLVWSPIVDSIFFRKLGRRKSWIVPMQLTIGTLMLWIAQHSERLFSDPEMQVGRLTAVFTSLVFFAATQDIAVDGWALTLLSSDNLSYASTCQTFGLNTGYFASFTVFLALNSEDFTRKWGIPRLTLSSYLYFWALMCFSVTLWLLLFEKEDSPSEFSDDMDLQHVYGSLLSICKLKHVQSLIIMHIFSKIGFQANEAVTQLKMVEKGLKNEDMALSVLIDFPFQLMGGYLAARWAKGKKPLEAWIWAFWARLGFAVLAMVLVGVFPHPPITLSFFVVIVMFIITSNFATTIQFVGVSAFHTRISDPLIGGSYMTLLNTATNFGGTWPKYFVLRGVDIFSVATCQVRGAELVLEAKECVSEHGKKSCQEIGGDCITERDGYYYVSSICVALGLLSLVIYIIPTARRLQALPASRWRVITER